MKWVVIIFLTVSGLFGCTQKVKCPVVKEGRIVRDILNDSPDYRLNIFVTPTLLIINGANVGKIKGGRLSDQSEDEVYTPLLEAIYSEFKNKGDDPYREILIHAHEKQPRALLRLLQHTALSTHLAPVILVPVDFGVTTCSYVKPGQTKARQVTSLKNNILIRQERGQILVDGQTIVTLEEGKLSKTMLGENGIVITALLKVLRTKLAKLPKTVTPVLHITFDADLGVTRYILITAGKAGIFKVKTVRVLPQ
ncbi:hypothetical protein KKF84_18675 [Myxococcota bacterium]|nr:hypothetical protein [Myxococcota bacterium]